MQPILHLHPGSLISNIRYQTVPPNTAEATPALAWITCKAVSIFWYVLYSPPEDMGLFWWAGMWYRTLTTSGRKRKRFFNASSGIAYTYGGCCEAGWFVAARIMALIWASLGIKSLAMFWSVANTDSFVVLLVLTIWQNCSSFPATRRKLTISWTPKSTGQ